MPYQGAVYTMRVLLHRCEAAHGAAGAKEETVLFIIIRQMVCVSV